MIRLHSTRLMRGGEVALWHRGEIVWQGSVGSNVRNLAFDAVSLNTEDEQRMSALLGERAITADAVLATLADWWA
jgi:hypothetical protein